ncbi:molecular chaperone GrpE [Candidatus Phytoplasma luffae]|uniref:Protein GrpE n=1 Tax=Loofah witches'-broom phytoplasma TaxID=35773 RepID=A0A975FIR5_LOWBP|nr:nucleotide exchange factor GrpE [Candidatus Phytoplasma luffae]QTX02590.1 molecular chaperone GrpE [Candidatus Phytoplasma luffae]
MLDKKNKDQNKNNSEEMNSKECFTQNCSKKCPQKEKCSQKDCIQSCDKECKTSFSQNVNKKQTCDTCSPSVEEIEKEVLQTNISKLEKEFNKLKEELVLAQQKLQNDKLKHQADLENFKKRIKKENDNFLKYSSVEFITNLLVPLEQLEQALQMSYEEPLLKNFLSGFKMINQQIKDVLKKEGVQEIKALNEQFNPKQHHAIEKTSNKNEPNGVNLDVVQKGFIYKDLVIKPAMVKVNEWSDKNEENK